MNKDYVIDLYNEYVDAWNKREADYETRLDDYSMFEINIEHICCSKIVSWTAITERKTGDMYLIRFNQTHPEWAEGWSHFKIKVSDNNKIYKISDISKKGFKTKQEL